MSTDSVSCVPLLAAYSEAYADFIARERRCDEIAERFTYAGQYLRCWKQVAIANTGFPGAGQLNQNAPKIDAKNFPTIIDFAMAFAEWRRAKSKVRNLYEQIPVELRAGVREPAAED